MLKGLCIWLCQQRKRETERGLFIDGVDGIKVGRYILREVLKSFIILRIRFTRYVANLSFIRVYLTLTVGCQLKFIVSFVTFILMRYKLLQTLVCSSVFVSIFVLFSYYCCKQLYLIMEIIICFYSQIYFLKTESYKAWQKQHFLILFLH